MYSICFNTLKKHLTYVKLGLISLFCTLALNAHSVTSEPLGSCVSYAYYGGCNGGSSCWYTDNNGSENKLTKMNCADWASRFCDEIGYYKKCVTKFHDNGIITTTTKYQKPDGVATDTEVTPTCPSTDPNLFKC